MSETIKIRLAARCEAAGRPENEDNFQVAEDLSVSNVGFETDKILPLGSKGTLLLVCDGMGGMNAGEVASAVGVETIKNLFAPQLLTSDVFANDESVCTYMKRAIIKADSRIKEEAQKDSAKQGMGSTAVMAWLLGQKVYVAWCGDSRCYRYNPAMGLEQLSHDHSYVQDLVDTGQLAPELAFDHPNKNIITRSLGDPRGAAHPDAKVFTLHTGDVILLCSDGLNDSLRDSEIAQSIGRSLGSMAGCRDALWNDSRQAGWHDNVTIVLAQVVDENAMSSQPQVQPQPQPQPQPVAQPVPPAQPAPAPQPQPQPEAPAAPVTPRPVTTSDKPKRKLIAVIIAVLSVVIIGCCVWLLKDKIGSSKAENNAQVEQYQKLYNDLKNVSFYGISSNDIVEKVKKTIEDYDRFDKLGSELNLPDHPEKAQSIKEAINNEIQEKVIELNRSNQDEISNQIKKLKIKE